MTRAEQLAMAAKWALGVDARYSAHYDAELQVVPFFGPESGMRGMHRGVTPTEWQDAVRAALISIAKTSRESDAVAGRIFDAANGSVTDSVGRIATVPNTQLPAPSTEGN